MGEPSTLQRALAEAYKRSVRSLADVSDVDVLDNYMNILTKVFRNGEVGRMLAVFSSFETIHIEAYSYILESLKLPDSTYHEFLEIEEMREKHDFLKQYNADTLKDLIMTLGCFAAFVEGLQLFASFAMLLSFPKKGRMRNMGQIVSWSIRDETIHVNAGIKLLHVLCNETGVNIRSLQEDFHDAARNYVVMFGGEGKAGHLSDTWEWNGALWKQSMPATTPPTPTPPQILQLHWIVTMSV